MTLYYKATRTDATSFRDGSTEWKVGRITRHPNFKADRGLCSSGVLHAATVPTETLIGGHWPCRLFTVEPRTKTVGPEIGGHKIGAGAFKVIEELPAHLVFGPQGEQVVALIDRAKTLTPSECRILAAASDAARDAARGAAWGAAWDAARGAARGAARDAARDAARGAAWGAARDAARGAEALVTRDLITPRQFNLLYGPWLKATGMKP